MVDQQHNGKEDKQMTIWPFSWIVTTWCYMGQGWQAVVLGLIIVLAHLLIQTI